MIINGFSESNEDFQKRMCGGGPGSCYSARIEYLCFRWRSLNNIKEHIEYDERPSIKVDPAKLKSTLDDMVSRGILLYQPGQSDADGFCHYYIRADVIEKCFSCEYALNIDNPRRLHCNYFDEDGVLGGRITPHAHKCKGYKPKEAGE